MALLLWCACGAAAAAELRDVRVWAGPEGTRVVFDLDAATAHRLFTLSKPDRIVVDLPDTHRAIALLEAGKGLVKQLRSAPRENGLLRVVLDVEEGVTPRSFALQPTDSYGYRVVVDLADGRVPRAAAPAVTLDAKPIVIAIDAGHGGEDPGTHSRGGVLEKDVTMALARRLARRVDAEPGMKAVLIRDGDYYVELKDRVRKARDAQADLFISIHCNSYKDRNVRGSAVYVLSPKGASSAQARALAEQENMADLLGGVDAGEQDETLNAVLVDIRQSSAMEASYDVGGRLLSSLGHVNPLQKPHIQKAAFVVLKGVDVPSVLVETAFLTNDQDARLLTDPAHQDRMTQSMLDGVRGYFSAYRPQQLPPPLTASAAAAGHLQPVSLPAASATH